MMTTITEALLGSVVNNATVQVQSGSAKDDSFSQVLNEASNKKDVTEAPKGGNSDKKQPLNNNRPNNTNQADGKKNNNVESKENPTVNEDGKPVEADSAQKSESVDKPKDTGAKDNEQLSEAIVEEVAECLGISNEVLMQILSQLNIQPVDLVDAKNVKLVAQAVLGADNPVELLSMDGVTELFTQVEQAVQEAVEKNNHEVVDLPEAKPEAAEKQVVVSTVQMDMVEVPVDEMEMAEESLRADTVNAQEVAKPHKQSGSGNAGAESQSDAPRQELFGEAEIDINITGQTMESGAPVTSPAAIRAENVRLASPQEVSNQIIENIKVDIKAGVSEIKMNLKPESLGEVTLRIASENGIITAHFVAENQRVKEIIEGSFNQLQEALSEQGLNVMELSVSISHGDNEKQMQEFIQGRAKSQARIASILSALDENGNVVAGEIDETDIYNNNINYKV